MNENYAINFILAEQHHDLRITARFENESSDEADRSAPISLIRGYETVKLFISDNFTTFLLLLWIFCTLANALNSDAKRTKHFISIQIQNYRTETCSAPDPVFLFFFLCLQFSQKKLDAQTLSDSLVSFQVQNKAFGEVLENLYETFGLSSF